MQGICPPVSGQWSSKARSQEAASHPLLRSSADGRAFGGHCPSTCGQRQRGLRSFAIEGQLVKRCPFLVFRERTFGKWLTIKAHPPHAERITLRYVWIILARRRSEAVPLQVRHRTAAGLALYCSRSGCEVQQVCKNPLTCYAICYCTAYLRSRSHEKRRPAALHHPTCVTSPPDLQHHLHSTAPSVESVSRGVNNGLIGND